MARSTENAMELLMVGLMVHAPCFIPQNETVHGYAIVYVHGGVHWRPHGRSHEFSHGRNLCVHGCPLARIMGH